MQNVSTYTAFMLLFSIMWAVLGLLCLSSDISLIAPSGNIYILIYKSVNKLELIIGEKQGRKCRWLLFNLMVPTTPFHSGFSTKNLLSRSVMFVFFFCHANHFELMFHKFIHESLQVLFKTIIGFKWFIWELDFPSLEAIEGRNNAHIKLSSTKSQSEQNGPNSHC